MITKSMNLKNRTIFSNDNLPVLQGIDTESVALIYLDPPFNSNRNYAAPIGSEAAGAAFKDTWTLSDVDNAWHGEIADREPALYQAIHTAELTHGKGMKSYLIMMAVRLLEMKRVLKKTGSMYLHCDPTASHYLKGLMDAVFGKDNFRNEIVWQRTNTHGLGKQFGRVHDIILFYSKSLQKVWNDVYTAHDPEYLKKAYCHQDDRGLYQVEDLTAGSVTEKGESGQENEVGLFGEVINRTDIPKRSEKLPNYRTHKHTLFGKQEGLCNGCGTQFPFRNMTVDHIVPQSQGGTDHEDNLQLLCGACNSTKGQGTQVELISRLKAQGVLH